MYLFLYCEWLDSDLVKRYLPDAKFTAKVTLADYKVAFTSFTEDNSDVVKHGGCHLESSPGATLYGVVYEISADELAKIDKLTRVEFGSYTQKFMKVQGEDGKIYDTVSHSIKNPVSKSLPSKEYMDHMVKGAKEFGFPESYIESLEELRFNERSIS